MKRPRPTPRVLLVEGKTDIFVVSELLEAAGVSWNPPPVWMEDCVGCDTLLQSDLLAAELKATGLEALGILLDADQDSSLCWMRLRKVLRMVDDSIPDDLPPGGLVHRLPGGKVVGVWLMPDNVRAGMLETLLLDLRHGVPPELVVHLRDALAAARELGARVRDVHLDKAELYTWMAWDDPPDRQMHIAVKAGAIRPNEAFDPFLRWFKSLFTL